VPQSFEVKQRLSDVARAAFIGAALLAGAACAVFGFQHGFEEQVGWYLTLLPGAIIAAAVSDIVKKTIPEAESVAFWAALICLNFFWYFGISLAVI
jgi:hypothetical protein